jgi:hypothetical protein
LFSRSGGASWARQDAIAETGREALDLRFDHCRHVLG